MYVRQAVELCGPQVTATGVHSCGFAVIS